MFFTKLFYFFKGYVIIRAEGLFIERFINICIHRGLKLREVIKTDKTYARLLISNSDFKQLRPVARKSKVKVRILKKCGFFAILRRYRKRHVFILGTVLFVLFFAVSSRFIWSLEINGTNQLKKSLILDVLKEEGLYRGARKSKISSPREIKDSLMREFDDISWAWVYFEGTNAKIEIHEGKMPPEVVDKSIPCDVLAVCDGVIEKMTVKQGIKMVEENTAVIKGDVLIAGTVPIKDESGFRTVHATGTVLARTVHKKTGIYKLYNSHRIPTGNKKTSLVLELFSKTVNLSPEKNTFTEYDIFQKKHKARIGKYHFGISLIRTDYTEVEVLKEAIPYESAIAFAEYDLEQKISQELLPNSVLKNKETTVKNIDDETIEVTLLMEFTENIGTQKIINTD